MNEHPIRGTVDLNKLQEMLDKVLAEETPESLNRWIREQLEEDYKLPIYRGWVEEHYHHYDWSDEEVLACNPTPSDNFIEGFIAALKYCNDINQILMIK